MPAWIEVVLRSVSLLILLFLMTKALGKKQISQLSIFDYISGIVLGGIVAMHSFDIELNYFHGLIAMFLWFGITYFIEFFTLKNKGFRDFIQGKGTVFIKDGKVLEENLKKERFSSDQLLQELRKNNIFNLSDIEFAILEPSGSLSVLPKKENQPLTAKTIGLEVSREKEPVTVILDGEIIFEALEEASLHPTWLETELHKRNLTLENVFIGQVDQDNRLTIDSYDDKITVLKPEEKSLLLANLEKCQADLQLFALKTNQEQVKQCFLENSQKIQEVINRITPFIDP